jgi:two-component system chemotaxis response regulator CheY
MMACRTCASEIGSRAAAPTADEMTSAATAPIMREREAISSLPNPAKICSQLILSLSQSQRRNMLNETLPPNIFGSAAAMPSVLVIDDDPVTRTVVRAILESAGHTVSEADNGHTGVVMFSAISPDLVITDIFMPQKDGIETIRELRSTRPEIKILALSGDTGFDGPSILDAAQLLGADQVLGKPFCNGELVRVVEQVLARSSQSVSQSTLALAAAETHA